MANTLEISRRAVHSSVAFILGRSGHLFPDANTELSERLSGRDAGPKLALLASIEPDNEAGAASARPGSVADAVTDPQKQGSDQQNRWLA